MPNGFNQIIKIATMKSKLFIEIRCLMVLLFLGLILNGCLTVESVVLTDAKEKSKDQISVVKGNRQFLSVLNPGNKVEIFAVDGVKFKKERFTHKVTVLPGEHTFSIYVWRGEAFNFFKVL
jgi:hypothetical protein